MNRRVFVVAVASILSAAGAKAQVIDFDGHASGTQSVRALLQAVSALRFVRSKAAPAAKAAVAPACAIQVVNTMIENENLKVVSFTVASLPKGPGATLYRVSDGRSTEEAIVRTDDAEIETHKGVPHPTPANILADRKDGAEALSKSGRFETSSGQLIFTVKPGSRCAPFDAALLMFWIDEWFYFG